MGTYRADDFVCDPGKFVRDPGKVDGEALGFGFQEKRNTEFGGADDDGWGSKAAAGTLVVNRVWHGKRKAHNRPTQRLS